MCEINKETVLDDYQSLLYFDNGLEFEVGFCEELQEEYLDFIREMVEKYNLDVELSVSGDFLEIIYENALNVDKVVFYIIKDKLEYELLK